MLQFEINAEQKISKTEKHKEFSFALEKKSNNLISSILKLIQSFLSKHT